MANKIFLAIIALLVFAATAEALKCYNCGYFDGEAPDNWDKEDSEDSCRTGKKPNDELSVDCNDLRYFPVSEGKFIGISKTSGLAPKDTNTVGSLQATNNTTFYCDKLTMDGKVRGSENNLKLTIRSCILVESTLDLSNKCYANVNSKIVADIKEQALINIVYRYQSIFSDDAVAGICSCSTDDCNGAINSVNVSGFFLVVSTFLAYFSKHL